MSRGLAFAVSVLVAIALTACGDEGDASPESSKADLTGVSPKAAARSIDACLAERGYDSLVTPPQAKTDDAPDYGVAFSRGEDVAGGGEIALYGSETEARGKAGDIERQAEGFQGVVDEHGAATAVYFGQPSDETLDDVRGCIAAANSA